VTLCAIRAELSSVNIGVTISAVFPDIGENRIQVTLGAGNFLVHSAEGIAGLIVIEFWIGTYGAPTGGDVTVLTGNGQRAMGTSGTRLLR
jgi:hypothetical protein